MLAIKGDDHCQATYNSMKLDHEIAYLTFKIKKKKGKAECISADVVAYKRVQKSETDHPDYVTEKVCASEEDYRDEFIADLKGSGEPRFSVVDYNHKLLFISWVPDTSKAAFKMKYASIKEAFIQELVGVQIKVHATDDSELNSDIIEAKCASKV